MAKKKAGRGGARKGAGRKPTGKALPKRTFRISDADWIRWFDAAEKAGKSVSEWLREVANAACE